MRGNELILFLLFSIPVVYILLNFLFNNEGLKKRAIVLPFLYGMVLSIPYYLIYWSAFGGYFNTWTATGLYTALFLKRDGSAALYITVVIAVYFLVRKGNPVKASRLREFTAYLAGMFFTLSIYDSLVAQKWYGVQELFLVPLDRIGMLMILAVFLDKFVRELYWSRYIWAAAAVFVPFVYTFIPYLSSINSLFISFIICIILTGSSIFVYIQASRSK